MEQATLTVEKMSEILHIRPNTMHNRKWQERTGCPIKKVGKRLLSLEEEFYKWLKNSKCN